MKLGELVQQAGHGGGKGDRDGTLVGERVGKG